MLAVVRKLCLAFVLVLIVLSTGAWQSNQVALAQSQGAGTPETPLYPGFTWSNLGDSTQNIRTSPAGDSIAVAGQSYKAAEQFTSVLPEALLAYYSNEQLAKSGWESYDVVQGPGGVQHVFSHASGAFLSVNFVPCTADPTSTCVVVWQGDQVQSSAATPGQTSVPGVIATASTFGKTSPANGATDVSVSSVTLSWESFTNVDKYKYCINEGSACAEDDPDWTSSYDRSVTLTNLVTNKTYYWQVKATTCETCVPKDWTYADNGTAWKFSTRVTAPVTILGNAGVGSARLSYTDGTAKSVTADSTGAYSIRVPSGWTGTVTPSKTSYLFTPASASFTNLTATQTIQNFTAILIYTISGNVGVAGATLSYVNGTPLSVVSDAAGNYSIAVPAGWTGTVTPSKTSYTFSPASKTYTNLGANQAAQNYIATFITYTITGTAGGAGVTLTYDNGGPQFTTSDAGGNYSITVPQTWTGDVKPYKIGFSFSPASRHYDNVQANFAAQNYSMAACPSCADLDTTGVFRPSNGLLYLKNLNITGFADVAINYGLAGDYPVVGDWDGNGNATLGIYRNGYFYLRNSNTIGFADIVFAFGQAGDQPVAGDWDGNGTDTVGVFRPSTAQFFLRNSNSEGTPDLSFALGNPGDVAIAGDWTNKGYDTTGVFRPANGLIYLKNTNTSGIADIALNYGLAGDKPITGDWDNNGTDTIGVYRGNVFFLRNSNTVGFADLTFALGNPGDMPIAGDWDSLP